METAGSHRRPAIPPRGSAARPWLAGAVLIALVAIVYGPSLQNGFIWDDELYVLNNTALRSVAGLRDIWLRIGSFPQYYPLVLTSFWIEYHLWGLVPTGYHATNLVLHAIASVLVWRLLARLAVPGAWFAAALFAVHPVHVESVAWVTERKNVLSLVFALGALLAYLRASPPDAPPGSPARAGPYASLALLLYVAALLSKTVTASVPAVLLVVYWWKRGRFPWREVPRLAPFFAVGLALAWLTVRMEQTHVGAVGSAWQLSAVERGLIAGRAVWFYAGKLLWPHPLVFFYPRWHVDPHAAWQYAFPILAALVVLALYVARRRIGRGPLAAVLVFVGVLVPALGFFDVYPFRFSFVADHFQYHASIALLALAAAAGALACRRLGPSATAATGLALLVALVATARPVVRRYRDLPTLYASVLALNPSAWAAHNNLGRYLLNQGQYREALPHFEEAARLAPQDARIRNNLGVTLSRLGRLDEAERELRHALLVEGEPTDRADTGAYLGYLLIEQGRFPEAAARLETALTFRPGDAWILYNLGVALAGGGDLDAGAARLRQSLVADPDSAMAHHELGAVERARGDATAAVAAFTDAVQLAPDDAVYRADLGAMLLQAGDLERAERELRRAVALDPRAADAHNSLGILLAERGDRGGARAAFEAALRADPTHANAAENLRRLQP